MEVKRERFRRLATKRTNEVLKRLKILSNCANRYAYDYNEDDVKRIFEVIDDSLKKTKSKFYSEVSNSGKEFKL